MYNKISNANINELTSIVGKEDILVTEEAVTAYASDETPGAYFLPEAVVRPSNSQQVLDILKLANIENFPVIPRGGGTGITGGALAAYGGIVVAFERFNRIIDIDTSNRMAVIEPGVINGVLQNEAEKSGLLYPINPASMDSCTLGGNVAEATGGANTVRYGTTRNYICGMKAITGDGNIWKGGGKLVKNSTDHNLIQLMCGSEGTLSIFTELIFKLIQLPKKNIWIIAPFKNIHVIPLVANEIFKNSFNPTMVELMDSATLSYCSRYLKANIQFNTCHQLLIRLDGDNSNELERISEIIGGICMQNGAEDILIADTKTEQEKIWKIRSGIHDAIVNFAQSVCEEDVVVPVYCINKLIYEVYKLADKYNLNPVLFGHMGDGNLHVNYTSGEKDTVVSSEDIMELRKDLFKAAFSLGGKLSGEHGIGISKKPFYSKYVDSGYIKTLKNIKKVYDPNNILNPGKILDI